MDDNQLTTFLEELTPADFARILARIPQAHNYLPQAVPHLERVSALLHYVRSSGGTGQDTLGKIVRELFPNKLPGVEGERVTETSPAASGASRTLPELSEAELRRLMTERLSRTEIGVLWFDLFGTTTDEDLPGRSKQECVIELLSRCTQRRKVEALVSMVARSYPHVLDNPR